MNLEQFQYELKIIGPADWWGTIMDSLFECAGHMLERNLPIPDEWKYRAGMGSTTDEDNYFHKFFEQTKDNDLVEIGSYLFTVSEAMDAAGLSY